MNIAFEILFLILSNISSNFTNYKSNWKLYTTFEALSITKKIELVEKKEFNTTTLDLDKKIFVVHITSLTNSDQNIYPFVKLR